jgi:hypothetical protein
MSSSLISIRMIRGKSILYNVPIKTARLSGKAGLFDSSLARVES